MTRSVLSKEELYVLTLEAAHPAVKETISQPDAELLLGLLLATTGWTLNNNVGSITGKISRTECLSNKIRSLCIIAQAVRILVLSDGLFKMRQWDPIGL